MASGGILHFACICAKVNGSAKVPRSKLPLPFDFCHCNICRHQTGLLCASYLTLPDGTADIEFHGPLSHYKTSSGVTRTFCGHCGANIYIEVSGHSRPEICTGVLDQANDIAKLRNHIFVPDSLDGGLSDWIPDIPAWEGFSQSKQVKIGNRRGLRVSKGRASELRAHCHCQGVQFKVTEPSPRSKDLFAPYPDLLSTHVAGNSLANREDRKWWLCAGGSNYLAGTCACRTCRLASGFDIQMWCFVPLTNILQPNGDPLDLNMGNLSQYESSEGVYRHFCSKCGAVVFWRSDERPELIDVSVGILDSKEGARAEDWLEWQTDRISFEEEAQNEELVSRLEAGLRLWGGPASSPSVQDQSLEP